MKLKAELGWGYVFEEELSEEEERKWKAGVWNIADIIMRREKKKLAKDAEQRREK